MKNKDVDYSIIIPVYFNEGSLKKTFKQLKEIVIDKNHDLTGEIIFIDDGSADNSLNELLEIREANPELVKIIKFTRNFGQPYARLAGYRHANGKCFIHISADLQDPPELVNSMLHAYFNENYEIVIGERTSRDESLYRRITSRIFFWLIRKLSFPNMPVGGFDYHLIGRRVRNIILKNQEANPYFQGQVLWTGYNIKFIKYERKKREIGKSRWTFGKKLKLLIDGVMGYSFFPLRLMMMLGLFVSLLGFAYALYLLVRRIFGDVALKGWTSIMIALLILSGVQMLLMGIIGEYLWRTLDQVRRRQPYIIEEIFEKEVDEIIESDNE
jgi:glycosyltransferase involved in cell wall biosynthesis